VIGSSATQDELDTALAISELVSGNIETMRSLQGFLLQAGVNEWEFTPQDIAEEVNLSPTKSRDLCRQLTSIGAAERLTAPSDPLSAAYRCDEEASASILETTILATRILAKFKERSQSSSTVQPLVTLPKDPSFGNVTPQDFGFEWLMPSLSGAINKSEESIQILMPFFETDGFAKLESELTAALERGVEVTIVGRYLSDRTSHNRRVLGAFVDGCRERGVPLSNLSLIDYTQWESTDGTDQGQDGDQPSFTLHAKVMVFDGEMAYIGSANVTDYGFEKYLELGVLIRGPPVAHFAEIISFLLNSDAATPVTP
jgi:phosphatidylserine/phosphatidylglycerophosphate/cardiolipin synthase-like enzyme